MRMTSSVLRKIGESAFWQPLHDYVWWSSLIVLLCSWFSAVQSGLIDAHISSQVPIVGLEAQT